MTPRRFNKSSRPEVFCKKGVLRTSVKFTGKHLCQSLCFIKVAETLAQVFSFEFGKFLRTPFLTEHFGWLLLVQYLYKTSFVKHTA